MRAFLVISLVLCAVLNFLLARISQSLIHEVLSPTGYHFYSLSLPSATVAALRLPSGFRVIALVALVFGLLGCWHRLHMLGWWRRFHINALTSAAVVLLLLDIVGVIFLLWRLSLFSASFHADAA